MTTTHTPAPGWTLTADPVAQRVTLHGPGPEDYACAGPDAPDLNGRALYALGQAMAAAPQVAAAPRLPDGFGARVAHALQHAKLASSMLMDAHKQRPDAWLGFHDDALVHSDIAVKDLEVLSARAAAPEVAAPTKTLVLSLGRITSKARRHCEPGSPVLKAANEAWENVGRMGLWPSPLRDADRAAQAASKGDAS